MRALREARRPGPRLHEHDAGGRGRARDHPRIGRLLPFGTLQALPRCDSLEGAFGDVGRAVAVPVADRRAHVRDRVLDDATGVRAGGPGRRAPTPWPWRAPGRRTAARPVGRGRATGMGRAGPRRVAGTAARLRGRPPPGGWDAPPPPGTVFPGLGQPGPAGGAVAPAQAPPPPTPPRTPRSWLPDPSGRHELRYWDGTRFTEHVADGGKISTDPM